MKSYYQKSGPLGLRVYLHPAYHLIQGSGVRIEDPGMISLS